MLLSRAVISDSFAKPSRKNMRERVPPFQNPEKRNIGGFAANIWYPFFEFWRGGTRSLIVILEHFAKESLITARDNKKGYIQIYAVAIHVYMCVRRVLPLRCLLAAHLRCVALRCPSHDEAVILKAPSTAEAAHVRQHPQKVSCPNHACGVCVLRLASCVAAEWLDPAARPIGQYAMMGRLGRKLTLVSEARG